LIRNGCYWIKYIIFILICYIRILFVFSHKEQIDMLEGCLPVMLVQAPLILVQASPKKKGDRPMVLVQALTQVVVARRAKPDEACPSIFRAISVKFVKHVGDCFGALLLVPIVLAQAMTD
jgi:hypothetical protein